MILTAAASLFAVALGSSVPATTCFSSGNSSSLVVDVGNAQYRGFFDTSTNQYSWLGMKYAEAVRFQQPAAPPTLYGVVDAYAQGDHCSQFKANGIDSTPINAGSEQCLFLNVYVPVAVRCGNGSTPVVVWIHGGGYGYGYPDAFGNATNVLPADGGNTILVTIQYRLGVFGFLAGTEIHKNGDANLGIYDQVAALRWVHDNIASFGGNTSHVTIWGESAGGGSVMMLTQAFAGELGTSLWQGAIANSPYLPVQYAFDDPVPQTYYDSMVTLTGCSGPHNFSCLTTAPYDTVFFAGSNLSQTLSPFGTWSTNPVTDGRILRAPPSQALYPNKVNGLYMYAGHLTHEGHGFVPPTISTSADFNSWFKSEYPLIDPHTKKLVYEEYPEPAASNGTYATEFLRAAKLYGDTTFLCPAYWLALSYPHGYGYKYIDNVGTGYHGSDLATFFENPAFSATAYNISSDREYVVDSMRAFWETWDPAANPAVANLTWEAYDMKMGFSQVVWQLVNNSTDTPTFAYVEADGLREPKECTFWRSVGPMVPM